MKIIWFAGFVIISLLFISVVDAHKKHDDAVQSVSTAAQTLSQKSEQTKEHEESVLEELVIPFGIAALTLLMTTLTTGLLITKNRALILPWHKCLAILTASVATLHLLTVLLSH